MIKKMVDIDVPFNQKELLMMNYRIQACSNAVYQEQHMTFVLENYVPLHVPNTFLLTLGFTSAPILLEEECFIALDQHDEVIGAWSYLYGTEEYAYYNTEVIQIQSVILSAPYRKTRLFAQGLQHLVRHIDQSRRGVKEVRFWIAADPKLKRLCSKFAKPTSTLLTPQGIVEEYRVPFNQLYTYARGLQSKRHAR
ncbi:hypothetical protein PQ460_00725 [Paenibacillus sp. KACC 21273]|uniref:hypothetical protein n=1 Tax=Paenibacillus sp. KACC 21273 TaxID=3025665 RepID=UPI002365AB36|nr:hypothetical protein [Paenibacillus sp. KACC 21273]WDF51010.1 hypothetical protein PQ460_00725 [Paenibacillus sp. KACC 21273]